MSLTKEDLHAIDRLLDQKLDQKLDEKLDPIKKDLAEIKADVKLLAALNHLEEIKRDPRLSRLYQGT